MADVATATSSPKPAPQKKLYYLVDFDNLRRFATGKSIVATTLHLIHKTPAATIAGHSQIDVRLYGGWRRDSKSTQLAQRLAAEIAGESLPASTKLFSGTPEEVSCTFNIALVYAPLCLPRTRVEDTFVEGRGTRRLYTDRRPWLTCASNASCMLGVVEDFLRTEVCANQKCMTQPGDILKQDEQKQVDTLIVADMAYLAFVKGTTNVVVVTSDIDVWPGVLMCLARGVRVLHVHTTPGGVTSSTHLSTLNIYRGHYAMASV